MDHCVRVECVEARDPEGEPFDPPQLVPETVISVEIVDDAGECVWRAWADVDEVGVLADPAEVAERVAREAGWAVDLDGVEWFGSPGAEGIHTEGPARRITGDESPVLEWLGSPGGLVVAARVVRDESPVVSRHAFAVAEPDGTPMLLQLTARRENGTILDCGSIVLTPQVVDDLRTIVNRFAS